MTPNLLWVIYKIRTGVQSTHLKMLPTLCAPFSLTTNFFNHYFPKTTGISMGIPTDAKIAPQYGIILQTTLKSNFLITLTKPILYLRNVDNFIILTESTDFFSSCAGKLGNHHLFWLSLQYSYISFNLLICKIIWKIITHKTP